MCGRFTLRTPPADLAREFDLAETPELPARFNVAPGQAIATIDAGDPPAARRSLRLRRWGLVPSWATDSSIGSRLINARSETAARKPAFRDAFRRRRCVVPADGFYEWAVVEGGGPRQPHHLALADGGLFSIAGLWERWRDPQGDALESCTLLTVDANAAVQPLHDRMPAILLPDEVEAWLDPAPRDADALRALLRPLPPERMCARPVSPRVNDPRHDDDGLLAPYTPPPTPVQGVLL